jgi:endonuclease/exonuclease/phosphatase family metal-dependent hydrolase
MDWGDGQFNPKRTMTVTKEIGADVIALQEVDQRFGNRANLLDLNALEQESGLVPIPLMGVRSNHGWRGNLVLVRDGTVTAARQLVLAGAEPRGALIAPHRASANHCCASGIATPLPHPSG